MWYFDNLQAFDDVERKVKPKENPFEYKKRITLDQEKSKMSLGEIYEQEYLKQQKVKKIERKIVNMFLHMFFFTYVLGAQKNHLIEMVLLSTHNICFD